MTRQAQIARQLSKLTTQQAGLALRKSYTASHLIAAEAVLLQGISYRLSCRLAVDLIPYYMVEMDTEKLGEHLKPLTASAYMLANDCYRSDVVILFEPEVIALACVQMAWEGLEYEVSVGLRPVNDEQDTKQQPRLLELIKPYTKVFISTGCHTLMVSSDNPVFFASTSGGWWRWRWRWHPPRPHPRRHHQSHPTGCEHCEGRDAASHCQCARPRSKRAPESAPKGSARDAGAHRGGTCRT